MTRPTVTADGDTVTITGTATQIMRVAEWLDQSTAEARELADAIDRAVYPIVPEYHAPGCCREQQRGFCYCATQAVRG